MPTSITRTQFLRGDFSGRETPLRPPWALPEALFISLCTGCGECVKECPQWLLSQGRGGYPVIDFNRGGCDFCGECLDACGPGALARSLHGEPRQPWQLRLEIGGACLAESGVLCRICGDHCEAGAIRFRLAPGGVARPRIDPAACTACGACIAPCPSRAISLRAVSANPSIN